MQPRIGLAWLFVVMATFPAIAESEAMRIVFDEGCIRSCTNHPDEPFDLWIVYEPGPGHCDGCRMIGIHFTITGMPADWQVDWVPHPAASFASDPFASAGAAIQFLFANSPDGDCRILFRCRVTPTATRGRYLSITSHPQQRCPILPPGPSGPMVFYSGGGGLVEGSCLNTIGTWIDGTLCPIESGIDRAPWEKVKRLFR